MSNLLVGEGRVMKKYLSYVVLICLSMSSLTAKNRRDSCDCEVLSHSYLSIRPNFQSAMPEMVSGFRDDRVHARECGIQGAGQAVIFGGRSTNSSNLRQYFFPSCKDCLIVDESCYAEKDLQARHFNIFTQNCNRDCGPRQGTDESECFRSKISIAPEQSVIGLGLMYRQSFWRNEETCRGFWTSVSFPIERVKNSVNLTENVINDGGGPDEEANDVVVANMTQAFMQKDWKYGKIACGSRSRTNVAAVELKLGVEALVFEPFHVETYVGLLLPAGTRPNGEYLFEPVVGWGKHFGLMWGSNFGLDIWADECNDHYLRMEHHGHAQYLFSKRQIRSFDLVNKPWSRYMAVYANREQAELAESLAGDLAENLSTPGINVFTQEVDVTPGFMYNMTSSFVYTHCAFQAEIGWNLFTRRNECVKLACPWKEGPALKSINGGGDTNPFRTISGNVVESSADGVYMGPEMITVDLAVYENSIIKEEDLDLASAATPCGISNMIYGAIGWHWDDHCYPIFINSGASYEFSNSNNAILDRWTLWAKFGVSF